MPPKKPTSRQDYRWTQLGFFRRCNMAEFGDVAGFANLYSPQKYANLQNIIASIKSYTPKYITDTVGTLDVGAALSGEPECFIRRENKPSKRIRMGVNPSNHGCRVGLPAFKEFAYAALALTAKRMGYIVEAEMTYGGMSELARDRNRNHSIRVELGVNIPVHVLTAYSTNDAIQRYSNYKEHLQRTSGITSVHYQSQDRFMADIIQDEYDICLDRLTEDDTLYTMSQYVRRNLTKFGVSPEDQNKILSEAVKAIGGDLSWLNMNHSKNR